MGPKLFFQCAGFVGMEFIFLFVKKKILVHLTQLSYSINESLSHAYRQAGEVAVRDSSAGAKGQKPACGSQARSEKTECSEGNAL